MDKKISRMINFGCMSLVLGFICGVLVWAAVRILNLGIDFIWTAVPSMLGKNMHPLVYNLILCLAGGAVIGLFQQKTGVFPDDVSGVTETLRKDGRYPYDRLHLIAVSALLPLVFGGAVGPEAGLAAIIAGSCCLGADKLGRKSERVTALMEAGVASSLGVIFSAPLLGIADQLEPDSREEKYRERLLERKGRIFIYAMGILGGMVAMTIMNMWLGYGGGLARFDAPQIYGLDEVKWFPVLFAAGVVSGFIYLCFDKVSTVIGILLGKNRLVSCMTAGAVLAVLGWVLPMSMQSGEQQLEGLIENWESMPASMLVLTAAAKLFLLTFCIELGWKGGSIFPLIYSGASLGYGIALLLGMNGAFAAAVTVAALYGYVLRKPVTVTALLLFCFPITYILPVGIASAAASFIPVPKQLKPRKIFEETEPEEVIEEE